jgi:hypothetical protein
MRWSYENVSCNSPWTLLCYLQTHLSIYRHISLFWGEDVVKTPSRNLPRSNTIMQQTRSLQPLSWPTRRQIEWRTAWRFSEAITMNKVPYLQQKETTINNYVNTGPLHARAMQALRFSERCWLKSSGEIVDHHIVTNISEKCNTSLFSTKHCKQSGLLDPEF